MAEARAEVALAPRVEQPAAGGEVQPEEGDAAADPVEALGALLKAPLQERLEGGVVDVLEVVVHIELEVGAVLAAEARGVVDGEVEVLAAPAGVAVVYGVALELRLEGGAEAVVEDAVAEGGGADEAGLGLVEREGAEGGWAVLAAEEVAAEGEAAGLEVRAEVRDLLREPAPARRSPRGADQGAEVRDLLKEVACAPHLRAGVYEEGSGSCSEPASARRSPPIMRPTSSPAR